MRPGSLALFVLACSTACAMRTTTAPGTAPFFGIMDRMEMTTTDRLSPDVLTSADVQGIVRIALCDVLHSPESPGSVPVYALALDGTCDLVLPGPRAQIASETKSALATSERRFVCVYNVLQDRIRMRVGVDASDGACMTLSYIVDVVRSPAGWVLDGIVAEEYFL